MTLEEILKDLKKGECKKCETTDDRHRVIEVLRMADEGSYVVTFNVDSYDYRCDTGWFTSIEGLFKWIRDMYPLVEWTEFDYEVFIPREKLKEENAQLKKALNIACDFIEGKIICKECPFDMNCNKDTSRGDCVKILCEYFLEKAKTNEFR